MDWQKDRQERKGNEVGCVRRDKYGGNMGGPQIGKTANKNTSRLI